MLCQLRARQQKRRRHGDDRRAQHDAHAEQQRIADGLHIFAARDSLDQIGAFISSGDVSQNLGSMAEQAGLLQRRCEELLTTVTVLQKKIRFIQEESACAEEGTFRIKAYPERPYLPIGEEIDLFTYEPLYFYPIVGFYTPSQKHFGAYLFGDSSAEQILAEGARRGYELADTVVTLNIIDQFSEGHPGSYVTALETRILPA